MKAARIHNFGGPEVIVLEDVPRPIHVISANRTASHKRPAVLPLGRGA